MNDTSEKVAALVAATHRRMTPEQRMQAASALFDAARAIVESSLPTELSLRERRMAVVKRLYGSDLSLKAMTAFADWPARQAARGAR
jgi:hypothetical protein